MHIFLIILTIASGLRVLSGCDKQETIYPNADNLLEIDSDRLQVLEAKDTENGVLVAIGESASRRCEIKVIKASLAEGVSANSLEDRDKIDANCMWDELAYKISKKPYTNIAIRGAGNNITVDLQLFNYRKANYIAFTLVDAPLP
ncbi:hypothetical protein ACJJIQ_01545 [Microbulbifer sp. ANSA003]|uniref:hypothetical protein n=1 Tax=Microbulbifer sp. ANSA003 TaxID=3243360 RepID=UPI004043907B